MSAVPSPDPASCIVGCAGRSPVCAEMARQIAQIEKAQSRALLCDDLYERMDHGSDHPPVPGWSRLGDDLEAMRRLKGMPTLSEEAVRNMFTPAGTSYRAMLYENTATRELVLAFRGSTGTILLSEDWRENAKQSFGIESEHYNRAKQLAAELAADAELSGQAFSITGHSKGGGMAGAGAVASGAPAITFNPAGVHANTIAQAEPKAAGALVTDFVVDGDFLNHGLQDNRNRIRGGMVWAASGFGGVAGAAGTYLATEDIIPKNIGERVTLPATLPEAKWWRLGTHASRAVGVEQHMMPAVRASLASKAQALREESRALGCPP